MSIPRNTLKAESGMVTRMVLAEWVVEALERMAGSGTVVDVCRDAWARHEDELRRSGDVIHTCQ